MYGNNNTYLTFNSLGEMHNYVTTHNSTSKFAGRERSLSSEESQWYATDNFEKAEELLNNGDTELASKISAGLSQSLKTLNSYANKKKFVCDTVGCMAHVPNAIAGKPLSMINAKKMQVRTPVLDIVVNISCNGGFNAENYLNNGIAILTAIARLEAAGTQINLYVGDVSCWRGGEGARFVWVAKIKNSTQKINALRVAYPLCHPSMLRRHSFRMTEITRIKGLRHADYGYAGTIQKRDYKELGLQPTAKVVNIIHISSAEDFMAAIK